MFVFFFRLHTIPAFFRTLRNHSSYRPCQENCSQAPPEHQARPAVLRFQKGVEQTLLWALSAVLLKDKQLNFVACGLQSAYIITSSVTAKQTASTDTINLPSSFLLIHHETPESSKLIIFSAIFPQLSSFHRSEL